MAAVTEVQQVGILPAGVHAQVPLLHIPFPGPSTLGLVPTGSLPSTTPRPHKRALQPTRNGNSISNLEKKEVEPPACTRPQPKTQLTVALGTASPQRNFHTIHNFRGIFWRQTSSFSLSSSPGPSCPLSRLQLPGAAKATQSLPLSRDSRLLAASGGCHPGPTYLVQPH